MFFSNLIFTVLILFVGAFISFVIIPFFGVKFCKGDDDLTGESLDSHVSMWDFIKEFPAWIWILSLLVFQACIIYTLNLWCSSLFDDCRWLLSLSRFFCFFAIIVYLILVNVTNDVGEIKWFKKKE